MLTTHQKEILHQSLEALLKNSKILIQGSAGVGKTTLVNELIKQLKLPKDEMIYCSAPTNKAVKLLKEKVTSANKDIKFVTTHSALKMKKQVDFKTGKVRFVPSFSKTNPPLLNVCLLIIDEASMLNTELLKNVEKYAAMNNTKVIFLGDIKQINPVGEIDSPVFTRQYPCFTLTEIIRQKEGNAIIELSKNLKKLTLKKDSFIAEENKVSQGYLFTRDLAKVVETLATVNGTDELKYLSWTNADVNKINFLVRRRIYGSPNRVQLGESLIFNKPFDDYHTNEEIKVESLEVFQREFTYTNDNHGSKTGEFGKDPYYGTVKLKYYLINKKIIVVHEDSDVVYSKIIKALKQKAKFGDISWLDFDDFTSKFADITYNHALTVHKSQGSTYKQVIINIKNINFNRNIKEREKLLYTAVTRASELLIVFS